jgi:hypothetical protein
MVMVLSMENPALGGAMANHHEKPVINSLSPVSLT